MPVRASNASARSCHAAGLRSNSTPSRLACANSASSTFSRTVIDANVAATWNVRLTPLCAICLGGRPSIRLPSSRTTPASGTSCPLIRLKHVVLPAPLGPISAINSPAGTENETLRTACTPSNAFERSITSSTALMDGPHARSSATQPPPERTAQALRKRKHEDEDYGDDERAYIFGTLSGMVIQTRSVSCTALQT